MSKLWFLRKFHYFPACESNPIDGRHVREMSQELLEKLYFKREGISQFHRSLHYADRDMWQSEGASLAAAGGQRLRRELLREMTGSLAELCRALQPFIAQSTGCYSITPLCSRLASLSTHWRLFVACNTFCFQNTHSAYSLCTSLHLATFYPRRKILFSKPTTRFLRVMCICLGDSSVTLNKSCQKRDLIFESKALLVSGLSSWVRWIVLLSFGYLKSFFLLAMFT